MWCAWRKHICKPDLKVSSDKLFLLFGKEEFTEYGKFLECHDYLLNPVEKRSLFIKESDLYGATFYTLHESEATKLAEWVNLQFQNKS